MDSQVDDSELQIIRKENSRLRAELKRVEASATRASERRQVALKIGWSVLFPLFDRKRVIRSFVQLMNTGASFTRPRQEWPTQEKVVEDAKAFSLSMLRFAIRRQTLVFILGLTAFLIPGIQLWLVYQQNEIIESQHKFFEIDVYDTVARGLTTGTASSKQVTAALLSKTELSFLSGMVQGVFEAGLGGAFLAQDLDARSRRLKEVAFQGYLLAALNQQIPPAGAGLRLLAEAGNSKCDVRRCRHGRRRATGRAGRRRPQAHLRV